MTFTNCCPQTGGLEGLKVGGTAIVRVLDDPYDGFEFVLPLDEQGVGAVDDYIDRTRHGQDGQGGDGIDLLAIPALDDGVFCLPSNHFDGRDYITLTPDGLTQSQSFAFSCWARVESYYKPRIFYSRGSFAFGHDFLNRLDSVIQVMLTENDSAEFFVTGSTAIEQDRWYHVACSWEPRLGLKVFLNGLQDGARTISDSVTVPATDFFLSRYLGDSFFIEGNMQECRLHPNARSAAWFLAEYENFCDYENFLQFGAEETL